MSEDSKELILVQTLTPAVVFGTPGGVDAIIDRVVKEIELFKPDVSTPAGREAIRAFAFKITKTKTGLEALGKDLVRDQKAAVKKIDEERGRLWDKMEELQKLARKPLDEFEAKEASRVRDHETQLSDIANAAIFALDEPTASIIAERIARVETWRGSGRDWQEFAARADLTFADTLRTLNSKLTIQKQRETERAELEAFRVAEAARIKKENEDRIAKAAADAARETAEKAAKEAADEAERIATAERDRIQKEADEAKEKAAQADRDRIAAEQRVKEAAEQADRDRVAAEQRANEAAAKAVRDEQARVAAQKKIADEAAAARAKDAANRKAKNDEVAAALLEVLPKGTPTFRADLIIEAIADGKIPHVTISY